MPIFIAASGPLAAKLAGRAATASSRPAAKTRQLYEELMANLAEGAEKAERDPSAIRKMIEIKVSYDRDLDDAFESCEYWAALGLSHEQKARHRRPDRDGTGRRRERRQGAQPLHRLRRSRRGDRADLPYVELGFEDLVLHAPGDDQQRFLDQFAATSLPALREQLS